MSLQHLLYRCPECGHDPVEATDVGRAHCPSCDARFVRERGASIRVLADGDERLAEAPELVDAIAGWEEENPSGTVDGVPDYEARVRYRRAVGQGVAYERGEVAGFYEEFTERAGGTVKVHAGGLTLLDDTGDAFDWDWSAIRAVQTSSRSLQLNIHPDGLFDLEFEGDSPRRWEGIMHRLLRAHHADQGSEVVEFQPRIVTEPLP